MSKYRAGDPSLAAKLRLKLLGTLMIWTGRIAASVQVSYRDAYLKRYGRPSLGQILEEKERELKDGKL